MNKKQRYGCLMKIIQDLDNLWRGFCVSTCPSFFYASSHLSALLNLILLESHLASKAMFPSIPYNHSSQINERFLKIVDSNLCFIGSSFASHSHLVRSLKSELGPNEVPISSILFSKLFINKLETIHHQTIVHVFHNV